MAKKQIIVDSPEVFEKVIKVAKYNGTHDDLALEFNVSSSTIKAKLADSKEFKDAYSRGLKMFKRSLRYTMADEAINKRKTAALIHLFKHHFGHEQLEFMRNDGYVVNKIEIVPMKLDKDQDNKKKNIKSKTDKSQVDDE